MQAEPGRTIERRSGTRAATTPRKLPRASPGTNTSGATKTIASLSTPVRRRLSASPRYLLPAMVALVRPLALAVRVSVQLLLVLAYLEVAVVVAAPDAGSVSEVGVQLPELVLVSVTVLLAPRLLTALPKPSITLRPAVSVPCLPPVQVQLVVHGELSVPVFELTFQMSFDGVPALTVNVELPIFVPSVALRVVEAAL